MDRIEIGVIVRPFGIKGEVKVKLYTEFPEERFVVGNQLQLNIPNKEVTMKVDSFRMHQGHALVRFEDHHNINDIEYLRNAVISIDKAMIHDLEDDQFYYFDLVGCQVFENQECIGEVSEIIDSIAHPILRIKTQGKDVMVPYVDAFIQDVDIDKKRIDVTLIEGMR